MSPAAAAAASSIFVKYRCICTAVLSLYLRKYEYQGIQQCRRYEWYIYIFYFVLLLFTFFFCVAAVNVLYRELVPLYLVLWCSLRVRITDYFRI